jgi:predicted nucleic acid-binding protein
MTCLLDNNVLSEWWKDNPDSTVVAFLEHGGWLVPSPVIAEIQEGAEADPNLARKIKTNAYLDQFLRDYGDVLVVNFDAETARTWGRLKHSSEVKRRPQPLWDSLIDAMAVRHDLIIATRNAKDFRHAKTFNPWSEYLPGKPAA